MRLAESRLVGKIIWFFWVAFVGALIAGCPLITVKQVELDAERVTSESFTLVVTVEVVEKEPAVDEEGNLGGGRGLLGVWLPPGWEVSGARLSGPQDAGHVELTRIADGGGHFPPPFPYEEGEWFGFVSECENLEAVAFVYKVEIDIQGDGSQTEVLLGVSAALFNDQGSNGPPPTEVRVDLAAATASVRGATAAPASAGLAACESIPYQEPAAGSGCTCASAGARGAMIRSALLGLLAVAF